MVFYKRTFYIIKQSTGVIWNFAYHKNLGIIYRVLRKNQWSNYNFLIKDGSNNFSVMLLVNDHINLLYEDLKGNIILSMYNGIDWSKEQILQNQEKDKFDVCFKSILSKNQIYIIYSILNKETKIRILFYQILDEQMKLSPPKIIDTISFNYDIPFVLSATNNSLYIIYQKLKENHQMGYRILNNKVENFSDFYIIDRSNYPYMDFSILISNDILYVLYVKQGESINSLIYAYGNAFNFNHNILFKNITIKSCSFFMIREQIWYFWTQDDKIYSSFSTDKGNKFTIPPNDELITSLNIVKSMYITNNAEEMEQLILNEIYVVNEEPLRYLIISANPNRDVPFPSLN